MSIDVRCINNIRKLSVETIAKSNSGHPGICLGAAPILHTLFTRHLNFVASDVNWPNRDKFVLSAGHGSALLYTMLHLSGVNITIDDLKQFRQKGSLTPGHPEYRFTPGVEMTTGPLGQGISTAVGMAIANKHLETKFNKEDITLLDNKVYVLCGDGDLQEGVTMEAVSLAGRLCLNNLIVLFDSNDIQLDGPTSLAVCDNIKGKFEAMNWNYLYVSDANDVTKVDEAISNAKLSQDKPTIIEIKSIIGYGAKNQGTASVHGKPLNKEAIKELAETLDVHTNEFEVEQCCYDYYKQTIVTRSLEKRLNFLANLNSYKEKYANDYKLFEEIFNDKLELTDVEDLNIYEVGTKISTRKVMGQIIDKLNVKLPNMIGGSADLVSSTMVKGADGNFDLDNRLGRNINFGVREHAMGAIVNGLTLSHMRGFGAGFFVFSDYLKPAIRLAALMKINSLFLFSHDSLCVGEDGPTHQPIEQLAGLRAMPNLNVMRPADAKEMTAALLLGTKYNKYPSLIVSSRQDLEVLAETNVSLVSKGAYVAYEPNGKVDKVIVTCGSELELCIKVAKELALENVFVRVVSMPSMFLFEKQSEEYKEEILLKGVDTLAVEMAASMSWYKYANRVFGVDTFGESMPLKDIYGEYGFTVENIKNVLLNK